MVRFKQHFGFDQWSKTKFAPPSGYSSNRLVILIKNILIPVTYFPTTTIYPFTL